MGTAEPNAMRAKEQSEISASDDTQTERSSLKSERSSSGVLPDLSSLPDDRRSGKRIPFWLRPFFSLRVQLMFIYGVILITSILLISIVAYQRTSPVYIDSITVGTILGGLLLAYIGTGLLMRPLWRVIDAAQAIALGDLKQRQRLPLRLPPQDDVDRLAGSINEMVTRLEHAEETQLASEQRFKRFFSDASHQLRTPLTSIRGFTEILMRGATDDPETTHRVLTRMKSEAERMTVLINNLLTLARLDDSHPLKTQYIDLIELATEGIEQAKGRANDGRKISLVLATHERLGVQADRERMKQLLFILLDNALKHGRPAPDGTITLQLERHNGQNIIRVIDNGEGITKEDLEHIFESFYRGRSQQVATGTPAVGAGLGLTIAHTIVRAHQGTISAYSEPGKGTEFKVALPAAL